MSRVNELIGLTLSEIVVDDHRVDNSITFKTTEGQEFRMWHEQDCCESVSINDICGDVQDLVGTPILYASEECNRAEDPEGDESSTWTFYKFATRKGYVTIRWLGMSNGYYSESVYFDQIQ